jgi:DNA-binding response OmpR family regulator
MSDATVTAPSPARLMVVEDSRTQLGILTAMLVAQGYEVRPHRVGLEALAAAAADPPDLFLLDITMPDLNGYELCRRLKATPGLADVPVLFISANFAVRDKIEAFAAGGVDYLTKPYKIEEVRARVETHLAVARLRRELEDHNRRLEATVRERTRELEAANASLARLDQAKTDFLRLISHELRTPLNGVLGVASVVLKACAGQPAVERLGGVFHEAEHNLLALVDDALLLTQIGVADLGVASQTVPLRELLDGAVAEVARFTRGRTAGVRVDGELRVRGDAALLRRALAAVLETAARLSEGDEPLACAAARGPGGVEITVEARGTTIPDTVLPRLFESFAVAEAIGHGADFGLRLAVAREILSLFDGTIAAVNLAPAGIRFAITLPSGDDGLS